MNKYMIILTIGLLVSACDSQTPQQTAKEMQGAVWNLIHRVKQADFKGCQKDYEPC